MLLSNPIPADEYDVIWPVEPNCKMLELGNKKNKKGIYKNYFKSVGIKHISIDWNGKDGAIAFDLRNPIKELKPNGKWHQYFDIVTNIGTSEHVIPQGAIWTNMLNALKINGHLISITPCPGCWNWHQENGLYPTPEFYIDLAERNNLKIISINWKKEIPKTNIYTRMQKLSHLDNPTTDEEMLYVNKIQRTVA